MLTVRDLVKTFAPRSRSEASPVAAVDGVSVDVRAGEFFTLLGPSGCGKTTTLRCIAGLERPDSGDVVVGDRVLFSSHRGIDVPAHERRLGVVFQSYALWPHMNVFDTAAFPLVVARGRRLGRREVRERVQRVLAVVKLQHLADRPATDLSGGEQQRLALARALVLEPPVLLMDEPLSNLDARLREDMRFELKRLQRELGFTVLYVTHDQQEALTLSNVVAVMNCGRIEQVGRTREIYGRPASRFVADFIGVGNLIDGVVSRRDSDRTYVVATPAGRLEVVSAGDFATGASVVVAVRPEDVELVRASLVEDGANQWGGTVEVRAYRGDAMDHVVAVGPLEITARCDPGQSIPPGTHVTLKLPPESCSLIAAS